MNEKIKESKPKKHDDEQADAMDPDSTGDTVSSGEAASLGKEKTEQAPGSELLVRFSIQVAGQAIETRMDEVARSYQTDIKLPGFRKGNVPLDLIKSRYKKEIGDEALNKVAEQAVFEKIEKDGLKIVSQPVIEKMDHREGGDLQADIRVEVLPEVVLPDLERLQVRVDKKELAVEPFDETKQMTSFLERHRRRMPVKDRGVQAGDIVVFESQVRFLDSGRMGRRSEQTLTAAKDMPSDIPDLFREILGKGIGDGFRVTRTYGADFKKKAWAGKTIEHHLEVKSIFEMKLPETNAAFWTSMGFKDEAAFKVKLKQEYDDYAKNQREEKIVKQVVDKLVEETDFPVPRTLVEQEVLRMGQQQAHLFQALEETQRKQLIEGLKLEAEKSVRFSLIFDTLVDRFKIEVSSDDVEKEYRRVAEANKVPLGDVRKYYMKKENKDRLKDSLLRVKVFDFLREKIKVKEV